MLIWAHYNLWLLGGFLDQSDYLVIATCCTVIISLCSAFFRWIDSWKAHSVFVYLNIMCDIGDLCWLDFQNLGEIGEFAHRCVLAHYTQQHWTTSVRENNFLKAYVLVMVPVGRHHAYWSPVYCVRLCWPKFCFSLSGGKTELSEMLTYRVTWLPLPLCDTVLESRWREERQRGRQERWVQSWKESRSHPIPIYNTRHHPAQ